MLVIGCLQFSLSGEDNVASSDMESLSACKYPVEVEVGEISEKGNSPELDEAKRIQDEEISSSSKTQDMDFDENGFPVGVEKMKFADVFISKEEYPVWKKDGQYDGLLVFHENDQSEALDFCEKLQRHRQPDGNLIRICYLQQNSEAGKDENEKLEYYCNKSTYLMMFLTKSFCEDQTWMYFYQHRIVIHSVTDITKKWCAIPIHSEYWRSPKTYKTPFALQGIRGICLEDSHWEDGAVRMFRERYKLLKDRLHDEDLEFKRWYMREQGLRLIQWRRDKKKYLEKRKRDEEDVQRQIDAAMAAESESMELDAMCHHPPYAPGISVQRNVGATGEHIQSRVPVQAWGNNPQPQFPRQNPSAAMPGVASPPTQMSPELMKQFQMFLALKQMNPNGQSMTLDMMAMKNISGVIPGVQAPIINISADVVNFGDNSTTTIGMPQQSDDDDDDDC
jgi:hypothetical protein